MMLHANLLTMAAAIFLASAAFALPNPLAVWDGTFGKTTQGMSVVDYNGNTTTGGSLVINDANGCGAVFTGANSSLNNSTFIIKCSGLNLASANNQYLISLHQNALGGGNGNASYNKVGVALKAGNARVSGIWGDNASSGFWEGASTGSALASGDTTLVVNVQTSGGVFVWEIVKDANGNRSLNQVLNAPTLKASGINYKGFTLGGKYYHDSTGPNLTNVSPASGLTINALAVFGSTLSDTDILNFAFPSDVASPYQSTISLNFGASNAGRQVGSGNDPCALVADSNWYEFSTTSGNNVNIGDNTLTYSAPGNWGNDNFYGSYQKGYFDDHSGGTPQLISVSVGNLTGPRYDVYIYCASDNATGWPYKTVNGVNYTWDESAREAVVGTGNWGNNSTTKPMLGANTLLVKNVYPDGDGKITITSLRNGNYRGSISAIQICECQSAKVYTATVSEDTTWSAITWNEQVPAGGIESDAELEITVEGTPTITFNGESIPQKTTITGAPVLQAADAFYTNGCWEKTVASFANLTSGSATTGAIKTGFVGAYTLDGGVLKLRAQNREVISINIGGGSSTADTSPADNLVPNDSNYYGLAPVMGSTWNNISKQWQAQDSITLKGSVAAGADGTVTQRPSIDLSASAKNTWQWGSCSNPFLRGYLDDGGSGVNVAVHGIPYTSYDVIIYVTSDSGAILRPMTVNGTTYTYRDGATVAGTDDWGLGQQSTPAFGKNALYIAGLSGEELTITASRVGNPRATVCAVQVICQGDIVLSSSYVADLNATTAWNGGNGTGLTKLGEDWNNGQLSTLTLTNKANATLTFDTATAGQLFKVVSAAGNKLTIPASSFANMSFSMLDFSEAAGGVEIDLTGVDPSEQILLAGELTGTANLSSTAGASGWGVYGTTAGILMVPPANATRNNPVTGDSHTFEDVYRGADGAWGTVANWRRVSGGLLIPEPSNIAPGVHGGDYLSILVDGNLFPGDDKSVTVAALEGWNIQYAFMNGAHATVGELVKAQAGQNFTMYMWVDATSSVRFNNMGSNNHGAFNYYVAAEDGVTYDTGWLYGDNPISYYFTGAGSVKYGGAVNNGSHTIARCDFTVSAVQPYKDVIRKPLVKFTSTNKTFGLPSNENVLCTTTGITPVRGAAVPTLTDAVGTYFIQQEADGVYLYYVDYSAALVYQGSVTAATAEWSTQTGLSQPAGYTWVNGTDNRIELTSNQDAATLTFDNALTAKLLQATVPAEKALTLAKGDDAVEIGIYDFSKSAGKVELDFGTGAAKVIAGVDTVLPGGGTGELVIGDGCCATLTDGLSWSGTVTFTGSKTGKLRYGGTTTRVLSPDWVPNLSGSDGVIAYASPFECTSEDGFNLVFDGSVNRVFEEGLTIKADKLWLGNNPSQPTVNLEQTGGEVEIIGTNYSESGAGENSILLAHWVSTVNLRTSGGVFKATNTTANFGWDGHANWTIAGGLVQLKGIYARRASASDNSSELTLTGGTLELGTDGIDFSGRDNGNRNATLTFAGGTLKAAVSTTVKSTNAIATEEDTVTTLATESGAVMSVNATLSGTGAIQIAGDVTFTGESDAACAALQGAGSLSGNFGFAEGGSWNAECNDGRSITLDTTGVTNDDWLENLSTLNVNFGRIPYRSKIAVCAAGNLTAEAAQAITVTVDGPEKLYKLGWTATVVNGQLMLCNPRPGGMTIVIR